MKCEIISTGEVKHFPNNDATAHTLIKAGVLRLIENEPGDLVRAQNGGVFPVSQPPVEPRWTVGLAAVGEGNHVPAIVFEWGTTVYERFCGEPATVKQGVAFNKRAVPADIAKQYEQLHTEFYKGKDRSVIGEIFEGISRAARLLGQ
jgi:hypothetical protein